MRKKIKEIYDFCKERGKIQYLYIICMLVPLILTDSIILYTVIQSAEAKKQHTMENMASAVKYSMVNRVENVANTAKKIYLNKYIERFLEREFESPMDYVTSQQLFMKDTLLENVLGDTTLITMYADNDGIVNGGMFARIEAAKETKWYKHLQDSGQNEVLFLYYDDSRYPASERKRKLVFVKKLNYFLREKEKVLKLELDYSSMAKSLQNMNYDTPIYVCEGNTILMSNQGKNSIGKQLETFQKDGKIGYTKALTLYGMDLQIHVMDEGGVRAGYIAQNIPIVIILFLVNIIFPILLVSVVNRNKLREQEMKLARKNAELLALHSQINPHFLFNALESIRMHSVLKQEYETASMVEKLATMERQNVEWGNDSVEIKQEIEFVKAYLGLQKYRFGDRLSFELDVEESCESLKIPKLTIVTFVENACVHGIESKTAPGWIFVRAYKEQDDLCIEIEDTGCGMEEDYMNELRTKMEQASIESLKEKGRVGIINACLRLKMVTNEEVKFELDGEKGMGTMVLIRIPLVYLQ